MTGRDNRGPRGGGQPVDNKTLYNVALGEAPVSALAEHPREVRMVGTNRALSSRELAGTCQTLAMFANVFANALPPDTLASLRSAFVDIYADLGLIERPQAACPHGEAV